MASVGVRIHPSDDMGGRTFGTGGPSISRMSASEMYSQQSSKSTPHSITLEEAYWTDRRRKVGLARHSKHETTKDDEYQKVKEEQAKFVREKFHQKECRLFIPAPGQVGNGKKCKAKLLKCHCGEILSMHAGMRSRATVYQFSNCFLVPPEYASVLNDPERMITESLPVTSTVWKEEECLTTSPSNAFGKITFNVEQIGGKKPAKYIRLCTEDSVDDCLELMLNYWRIMEPEPPHLVISVVGGAKNFKLDGRMRDTFSAGLIKAAKTTSAWLITSGFNMGVMKAVGQAVHEGQTFQWDNDRMTHVLRCIGIAPWGYVRGRQYLESNSGAGKFNAYYRTSTQIQHKQPVPLNPDYTHFIFVDDGHRIRYGGVADFRSKFEKKISMPKEDGGLGIPVVLLVVEGGTDAIQDASASLEQGIPVVVCAGTGRAADILTYAYNHTTTTHNKERVMSDYHQDKLARKLFTAYKSNMKPGTEKAELEKLMKKVLSCCEREDLMIIFNMNKHEELDLAILSVLLKVETNSSRESQLKLAMTWNRADIAQEEILREDIIWKDGSLEEVLTQALVENKVDFVKLLLLNGIIMREYLTIDRLMYLYSKIPKHSYLYVILKSFVKSDEFTLIDICNFMEKMLDKYQVDICGQNDPHAKNHVSQSSELQRFKSSFRRTNADCDTDNEDEPNRFKQPYKQLMIWAILMNRPLLAQLFWELGEEPITSALVATRICKEMESKVPKYLSVVRNSFHELKDKFENLAVSVLDECHATDPDKAVMLVERRSPTWSKMTCLQIAASASDQVFVSSVACQNSIMNVWKSGIISSWPKVFIGAIFPPFIVWSVDIGQMGKTILSSGQKIMTFYTAPLTKFSMYNAAYAGFLILYTYMLLVDYNETPSATEWILVLWIMSFLIGGVHSFSVFPSPTILGKIRDFFGLMDRADFLNQILALIAFIVRWKYVYEAKVIYCFNAVVFYIRVMKLYTANRSLGPKIYMINRMFAELAMFLMVLMVFLLAYGVASQGLLYRHREDNWVILKDILFFPYWQLYGEIFLDEIETDEVCTTNLQNFYNGTLTDSLNTCRTFHWLVPLLLAGYLLVGNVLLINLLIAIFSHVFDTVERNAIEIWKFQMYFLVMEFQNRPILFPPLSIIAHIWYFVRWMYRRICCRKKRKSAQFLHHHLEYLSLFEKEMMANKLRALKSQEMNSMDRKFNILLTRMDELTRLIEDELIAEQYNMMPTLATENTMFAELGLQNIDPEEKEGGKKIILAGPEVENDLRTASQDDGKEHRKKHRHKKKKKREKERNYEYEMPTVNEEKQLNILVPEKEPQKSSHDKSKVISDEENQTPSTIHREIKQQASVLQPTLPPLSPSSSAPQDSFSNQPKISKAKRERARHGTERRQWNPILSVPQATNFENTGVLDPFQSDEEPPIPLEIYSPRASNLTVSSFRGRASSPTNSNISDNSSDSEVSFRRVRKRQLRRHISRGRDEDLNLESRIQRASRNSTFSNNYSGKIL